MTRRAARTLALVLGLALLVTPGTPAQGAQPRTSLLDVEDEVMCVTCNVALNIAESPQASAQRREIQRLIDEGFTKDEVKDRLVEQYGQRVLALPEGDGFEIAVYLVPIAVVLGLVGALALLVPRWRRARDAASAAAGSDPDTGATDLDAHDRERLDAELAAFDR